MTVHLIVFALCMVPAAWAVNRFGLRTVFSIAALLVGISLILCSRITQSWQLYILYGVLLGMPISTFGPVPVAIITRWFTERRGRALGIASAGTGFGTLMGAYISNSLITAYGWRQAFFILGIVSCIILLVCAYFIKNSPQLLANQNRSAVSKLGDNNREPKPLPVNGMTLVQAIKTREMPLIMLGQAFAFFTLRMIMVHIVPHATDIGISQSVAVLTIATIGGMSLLGRLSMGFVQDRIGAQRSMIICLTIQGISVLCLPFIDSNLMLIIFSIIFGFTYGGDIPQIPALTAQCFGVASIVVIFGLVQSVAALGGSLGPILAGYIFDLTNSYTAIFLAAAISLFVAVFCISRLRLHY